MTLPSSCLPTSRRKRAGAALAVACAAGALVALARPGAPWAAEPGEFVTCTLTAGTGGTVEKLQADVAAATGIDPALVRIDYVVVYSNALQNHGQPLPSGGTTGPVLCADAGSVSVSETSSDTPIPSSPSAPGIDIIETDQSLQVQYAEDEETKTLLCASYGDLDRCKGIAPVAVEPE